MNYTHFFFCSYSLLGPKTIYSETSMHSKKLKLFKKNRPYYRDRFYSIVPSMTPLAGDGSAEADSCYNPDDTVEKEKPIAKIDQKEKIERRIKTVRGYKFNTEIHFSHAGLKTRSDFMNCVNSPEIDTLLPIQEKGNLKSPATIVGQPPLSPMQAHQGLWNSQYAANFPFLELDNGGKEKTFGKVKFDEK